MAGAQGDERVGVGRARLVETLPSLQLGPNRPEDVLKVDADEDGVGGDGGGGGGRRGGRRYRVLEGKWAD